MSVSLILLGLFLAFGFIATRSKNPELFGFKKWESKQVSKRSAHAKH